MVEHNIACLDLNLLRPLHLLLHHAGVSPAAEALGSTQPAVSRILQRLRAQLGDPLLIRVGNRMCLTEKAHALRIPVREALERAEAIFHRHQEFSPERLEMTYRLGAVSASQFAILPALKRQLDQRAPGVQLAVRAPREADVDRLETGELDAMITSTALAPEYLKRRRLLRESFCCCVRGFHPVADTQVRLEVFSRWGHVLLAPEEPGPLDTTFVRAAAFEALNLDVRMVASSFLAIVEVVSQSDLIAILPHRFQEAATRLGLRPLSISFELPDLDLFLLWHPARQADPVHTWMRTEIARASANCSAR